MLNREKPLILCSVIKLYNLGQTSICLVNVSCSHCFSKTSFYLTRNMFSVNIYWMNYWKLATQINQQWKGLNTTGRESVEHSWNSEIGEITYYKGGSKLLHRKDDAWLLSSAHRLCICKYYKHGAFQAWGCQKQCTQVRNNDRNTRKRSLVSIG